MTEALQRQKKSSLPGQKNWEVRLTRFYPSMCEVFLKTDKSIDFYLNCGYYEHTAVTVPYLADYQMMNSSLALMAIDAVDQAHEISLETRLEGIKKPAGRAVWRR